MEPLSVIMDQKVLSNDDQQRKDRKWITSTPMSQRKSHTGNHTDHTRPMEETVRNRVLENKGSTNQKQKRPTN